MGHLNTNHSIGKATKTDFDIDFYRKKERALENIYTQLSLMPKDDIQKELFRNFNHLVLFSIEESGGVKKAIRKLDSATRKILNPKSRLSGRDDIIEANNTLKHFVLDGKGNFATSTRTPLGKEYRSNVFYKEVNNEPLIRNLSLKEVKHIFKKLRITVSLLDEIFPLNPNIQYFPKMPNAPKHTEKYKQFLERVEKFKNKHNDLVFTVEKLDVELLINRVIAFLNYNNLYLSNIEYIIEKDSLWSETKINPSILLRSIGTSEHSEKHIFMTRKGKV